MTRRTAAQAFSEATSALTRAHDATDVLARLLRDCADVLAADAIGLLIASQHELELLSSTSHQVTELEMFQIQTNSGPCVDVIRSGESLIVTDPQQMIRSWPEVGAAIASSGYRSVIAHPLRWHGRVFGAMNIFRTTDHPCNDEEFQLGQAFADIATLVIISTQDLSDEQVTAKISDALRGRTMIERAKGVLAYTDSIDMAEAYQKLVKLATMQSISLTTAAERVVADAQQR